MYERQLDDIERRLIKQEGKCEAYKQASMVSGSKAVRNLWCSATTLKLFYQSLVQAIKLGTVCLSDFMQSAGCEQFDSVVDSAEWTSIIAGWISDEEGMQWSAEREVL